MEISRPSRTDTLLATAANFAERGTCSRLQVGCVIAREGRILSTGYNGSPTGLPHCVHYSNEPCTTAEHAERNAIAFAARYGVALLGASLYSTHAPCAACSMSIINAGITEVFYTTAFRENVGLTTLGWAGIKVLQVGSISI